VFNRTTTKDVFDKIVEHESESDIDMPDDTEDTAVDETEVDDTATVQDPDPTDGAAAEEESDAATDADADAPTLPKNRKWLRRALVGTAVVLFVATVALAGFFGWQLKQERDVDAAGRAALDVAKNYAVVLTSVDNGKIDENFAQVLDGATGEFKDMYSQSAAQLRQLLIDNKAVSHGTVVDAGIKSATKNKVEVLIYVDQSISNTVNPDPRIDRSRVTITMERIDNRWLASKVDIK
jgi:Mce-associated membrane protein